MGRRCHFKIIVLQTQLPPQSQQENQQQRQCQQQAGETLRVADQAVFPIEAA
jgi:hypothetical protein